MKRLSLLEQMRMQRDQREAPLLEPYKAELRSAAMTIRDLRDRLRQIEQFMGKEIAKHVIGQISHDVSRRLMETIYKAVRAATGEPKPVRITLPSDVMRFSDPRSIESHVLQEYAQRSLPDHLSLSIDGVAPDQHVMTVDIRVPTLGCRMAVTN